MAVTLTESTKVSGANRATLYTRIENNRTERLIEWGGSYYLIGGTTGNLTLTPTAVNTATLQKDTTLSNNLIVYKDGGNIYIKDDNNGSVYSVRADSATNNGLSTVTYNLNVEAGTLGGGNSSNLETGTIDLNTARFLLNEKVQVYTPSSTTLGTQNNTPVVYLAFRENNTDQIYGYNTGTNTLSFIGNRLPAGVTVTQAFSGKSFQVISDNNGKVYLYADGTVSEPDWQNNTLVLVTKTTTNGTTGTLGGINNNNILNTIGGVLDSLGSSSTINTNNRGSDPQYTVYKINYSKDGTWTGLIAVVPEVSTGSVLFYDSSTGRLASQAPFADLRASIQNNGLKAELFFQNQGIVPLNDGRIAFVSEGSNQPVVLGLDPNGQLIIQNVNTGFVGDSSIGNNTTIVNGMNTLLDNPSVTLASAAALAPTELKNVQDYVKLFASAVLAGRSLVKIVNGNNDDNDNNTAPLNPNTLNPNTLPTGIPDFLPPNKNNGNTTTQGSSQQTGSSGNDALTPSVPSVLAQNTVGSDPAPAQTPAASTPAATPTPTPKPKPAPITAEAPPSGSNIRTQQRIVPSSSPPSTPKEEGSITIKPENVKWKYDEKQTEGPLVLEVIKPSDAKYNKDGTSTTGVWTVNRFEKTPTHYTFLVSVFKDGKVDSYERVNIPLEGMKGKVVRLPDAFKETKYIEEEKSVNAARKPTVAFLQLDRTESGTYTVKPLTGKAPVLKGDNKYDTNGDGTGDVPSLAVPAVPSAQPEKPGETNKENIGITPIQPNSGNGEQPKPTPTPKVTEIYRGPLETGKFHWAYIGNRLSLVDGMGSTKDYLVKDGKIYVRGKTKEGKPVAIELTSDNYDWNIPKGVPYEVKLAGGDTIKLNDWKVDTTELKKNGKNSGEFDADGKPGYTGVPSNSQLTEFTKPSETITVASINLNDAMSSFANSSSNTSLNPGNSNALETPLA